MRLNPGELVSGKYRITRLIGDGGMGAVYEARHEVLGSMVALKFLHADLARKPGLASRFLQEAKVSASIQSPHVTRVTDVDTATDGAPYLVMELLSGESLQQVLDRKTKLERDQAVDFALQILSGLEAAHALGVVHRDLKPDNVYVTPGAGGPVVKLLDFGIAKLRESNEFQKGLTRPGALMGTPEYMAPEQLYAADRVDHRADLYSVGAILYEMLAGERPAYGEDAAQIISRVAAGKIKRLEEHDRSIPAALADVVHRALSADKTQRFSSAHEMRSALAACAGQLSHAGRLAATAPPVATALEPPPERPAPTVDAPVLASGTAVAPDNAPLPGTWAAAPAGAPKGATQEAPREIIQELTSGQAARSANPANATVRGNYAIPYAQPGAPAPNAYAAAAQSAYRSAPGAYGYPTLNRPKSNRLLGALIALALGVVVTGAVVLAIALNRRNAEETNGAVTTAEPPPPTIISAQEVPPEPQPTPTPPPTPPATSPPGETKPGRRKPNRAADAGAQSADAGPVLPFPEIKLPPGFPPIPTALPPLPSGFPQIPGLPFPTEQPAPAPSR